MAPLSYRGPAAVIDKDGTEIAVECNFASSYGVSLGGITEISGSILPALEPGQYTLKLPDGDRFNLWFGTGGTMAIIGKAV
jgi:hypothetical protein